MSGVTDILFLKGVGIPHYYSLLMFVVEALKNAL